jgi:hypothetical protein
MIFSKLASEINEPDDTEGLKMHKSRKTFL